MLLVPRLRLKKSAPVGVEEGAGSPRTTRPTGNGAATSTSASATGNQTLRIINVHLRRIPSPPPAGPATPRLGCVSNRRPAAGHPARIAQASRCDWEYFTIKDLAVTRR